MKVICMEMYFLYFGESNRQREDSFKGKNVFFQEIDSFMYQMQIFLVF